MVHTQVAITQANFDELKAIFEASKNPLLTPQERNQKYIEYHQRKLQGFDGNPGAGIGAFGVQIRSGVGPLADYARAYVQGLAPQVTDAIFDGELAAHFIQADINWMQNTFDNTGQLVMSSTEDFIRNEIASFSDFQTADRITIVNGTLTDYMHPGYLFTSYFENTLGAVDITKGFWDRFNTIPAGKKSGVLSALASTADNFIGGVTEMAAIVSDASITYDLATGLVVKNDQVISAIPTVRMLDTIATTAITVTPQPFTFGSYVLNSAKQVINLVGAGYSGLTGIGDPNRFVLGFAQASIRKGWIEDPSGSIPEDQKIDQIRNIIEASKTRAETDATFIGFAEDQQADFVLIETQASSNYTYYLGTVNNNEIVVKNGHGIYDGNDGVDTLSYANVTEGINIDVAVGDTYLASQIQNGLPTGQPKDVFAHVENVIGSAHDDTIVGGRNTTVLEGGAGNDYLADLEPDHSVQFHFGENHGRDTIEDPDLRSVIIFNRQPLQGIAKEVSPNKWVLTRDDATFILERDGNSLVIAADAPSSLSAAHSIRIENFNFAAGGFGIRFEGGQYPSTCVTYQARQSFTCTLEGTEANDVIGFNVTAAEVDRGLPGDAHVYGNAGDDWIEITGGQGNDVIFAGDGNDVLSCYIEGATCFVRGENGDDRFIVSNQSTRTYLMDFDQINPNEKIDLGLFPHIRNLMDFQARAVSNLGGTHYELDPNNTNCALYLPSVTLPLQESNFVFWSPTYQPPAPPIKTVPSILGDDNANHVVVNQDGSFVRIPLQGRIPSALKANLMISASAKTLTKM